jgi:hypothetical protein
MTTEPETVTVSKEDVASIVAQAVAAALEAQKATKKAKGDKKPGRKPLTDEQKRANRDKTDLATFNNFTAKGYKDVQPRINVMTYNKWIENGRRVKKGEKATVCGSFALFHREQTEAIVTQH